MHDHQDGGPSMNQLIFRLGLSVETVSVYLLCCGLADAGRAVTTENLEEIWNGTPQALAEGLRLLERKNILRPIAPNGRDRRAYRLTGIEHWNR